MKINLIWSSVNEYYVCILHIIASHFKLGSYLSLMQLFPISVLPTD